MYNIVFIVFEIYNSVFTFIFPIVFLFITYSAKFAVCFFLILLKNFDFVARYKSYKTITA